MLAEGVPVSVQKEGQERGERVWLVDFQNPQNNVFFAINQYTVEEHNQNKRPDIILFVNGLPLVVIELKNLPMSRPLYARPTTRSDLQDRSSLPVFLQRFLCHLRRTGGQSRQRFPPPSAVSRPGKPSMAGKNRPRQIEPARSPHQGNAEQATLLDLIRNFIVFEKDRKTDTKTGLVQIETVKKLAAYHQYHAVNKAVKAPVWPYAEKGNRKAGVVWHTQGSGKSLSMVFYAGKLITSPEMQNPTIVVITDRNDLDDQLFDTFAASKQLLRQEPVQAKDRDHLKNLLKVASGGIVFTTIQKFFPEDKAEYDRLSESANIVVIADEAHRTQYGFEAKLVETKDKKTKEVIGKRIAYGFAKYMRDALPNATYIGFTGTPIESTDINTPAVFGQYVDIYDISQAVEDEAMVRIYYESRLAKVNLDDEGRRLIAEFDKELDG